MNLQLKLLKLVKMKTLVICSGGLDSVSMTILHKDDELTLLTFAYGQKATKENDVVEWLAKRYNAKYMKWDISSLSQIFGDKNQLTNDNVDVKETYEKSIVVPLRNGVFLQLALTYAYSHGLDKVILGSHLDDCIIQSDGDYAFPDCTPGFFSAMQYAAELGTLKTDKKVQVESASLINLHKVDLINIAYKIDKEALFRTWSCYKNGDKQCGECDSCRNRKYAFDLAGIKDETQYLN